MIKIEKTANDTITVTDTETKGVTIVLGMDCEIKVFYTTNMYMPEQLKVRTVGIYNKYNHKIVTIVDAATLDPSSTSYSVNMDTYSTNLRDTILYA